MLPPVSTCISWLVEAAAGAAGRNTAAPAAAHVMAVATRRVFFGRGGPASFVMAFPRFLGCGLVVTTIRRGATPPHHLRPGAAGPTFRQRAKALPGSRPRQ